MNHPFSNADEAAGQVEMEGMAGSDAALDESRADTAVSADAASEASSAKPSIADPELNGNVATIATISAADANEPSPALPAASTSAKPAELPASTTVIVAKRNGAQATNNVELPTSKSAPTADASKTKSDHRRSSHGHHPTHRHHHNHPQKQSGPPSPTRPQCKFRYKPRDFERPYYEALFQYVASRCSSLKHYNSGNHKEEIFLPPKAAAKFFYTSGVPMERLRLIWNMATMPAQPPPPGTKPMPTMSMDQFQCAVRLIQLFQNKVTAKDEELNVSEEGLKARLSQLQLEGGGAILGPDGLSPAFFGGVSDWIVPLPLPRGSKKGSVNGVKDPKMKNGSTPVSHHQKPAAEPPKATTRPLPSADQASPEPNNRKVPQDRQASTAAGTINVGESEHQGPRFKRRESRMVAYDAQDDDYNLLDSEVLNYKETFERHCVKEPPPNEHQNLQNSAKDPRYERHVYVDAAVSLFEKSGLNRETIGKLWDIVVQDPNAGKLNEVEFILMTHLIVCVTRRGLGVPGELPPLLLDWKKGMLGHNEEDAQEQATEQQVVVRNVAVPTDSDQNAVVDGRRFKEMEMEVLSLKALVISLRDEVKELKTSLKSIQDQAGSTTKKNEEDDSPNVDVEMYWGKQGKKGEFLKRKSSGSSTGNWRERRRTTADGVLSKSARPKEGWKERRRSSLSELEPTSTGNWRDTRRSSIGSSVSMNVPFMHRRTERRTSGDQPKPEVQSQEKAGPKLVPNVTDFHQDSQQSQTTSPPKTPNGTEMRGSLHSHVVPSISGSSEIESHGAKKHAELSSLAHQARERLGSGDEHSHASSSHHSKRMSRRVVRRSRPNALKSSVIDMSHHVVRYSTGQTQVYNKVEVEPPSTRALDLPPL